MCQNLNFVVRSNPDYVLILSGDHVYQMNYSELIRFHQRHEADANTRTISVPLESSRFGILMWTEWPGAELLREARTRRARWPDGRRLFNRALSGLA